MQSLLEAGYTTADVVVLALDGRPEADGLIEPPGANIIPQHP